MTWTPVIPPSARKDGPLGRARRAAHWALPRAAFVVETVAVAVCLFELITFAMFQGDRMLAAHEWGLFLTHYAQAPASARTPVDLAIASIVLSLSVFVAACRLPTARLVWRRVAPAEARIRGR